MKYKVKGSYSPDFVKQYTEDINNLMVREGLTFEEFLLELNMSIPEEYQVMYEDEISPMTMIQQIRNLSNDYQNEFFIQQDLLIREEITEQIRSEEYQKARRDIFAAINKASDKI